MHSRIGYARRSPSLLDRLLVCVSWHRGKLAAATASRVLLIGVALGLIFSPVFFEVMLRQESKRMLENISGQVTTMESTARVACLTGDRTLAREVANGLLGNRAVVAVRITSGSRLLAEASRRGNNAGAVATGATVTRKISSSFNNTDEVGEVVLVTDDEYIREQAGRYSSFIVLASIVEMIIAALAVAWVALRVIVRPIREFSDKLNRLDVDSCEYISYPKGNEFNEIGHLAYSFNNLLGHLFLLVRDEQELRVQLAQKESRFRALAENSPNLIVRYDAACRRVYCNPAFCARIGVEAGAALNTTPSRFWRAGNMSAAEYQGIVRHVMESGVSEKVLLEWLTENGQVVSNDFHLVPEWDANGRVESVLAIGHDISALKRQQRMDVNRARVFERMVHGGDLSEVLGRVAEYVENALNECQCAILLQDRESGCLRIGAAPNLPKTFCSAVNNFALGFPAGGDAHSYWVGFGLLAKRHGIKLRCHEVILDSRDRLLGMLTLYQAPSSTDAEFDESLLLQACNIAAIAIEHRHVEELVQHQASYDSLTDLPNRRMFGNKLREEIAKASRKSGNVALLFIDLDRFKGVNDTLGHEMGDQLLVIAALRIRSCMREFDTVARFGGDEFVAVIPDVEDVSHLERVARDIVQTMNVPFELSGHTAYVTASIGIASYPSDAETADRLVINADQAMYAAKEAGRNGFQFYSEELSVRAKDRLMLEVDLRNGMARNELELYYQPKVNMNDGSLIGSEALVRWNHPQRGLVPPDKFIGIAEDSGLIDELGEWVMRSASRTASEWNGADKPLHKVAINLSARQFRAANLHETVREILRETACRPEWIELEITESLLLDENDAVLTTLRSFRQMGISIAIDDFGTGYSALSYLARFPISTLKIDRSFVKHVTAGGYHTEVVKAIISIARSLNQQVVAEGVETVGQAEVLRACGCHIAQGFLYSKPVQKRTFRMLPLSFIPDVVTE